MRAILVGAGRMGLTHLALFNLLSEFTIRWTIIEPSRVMRAGLKRSLNRNLVESIRSDFGLKMEQFDFAVVANPTIHHATSYEQVRDRSAKCFIEKPLAVPDADDVVFCGYVLLHHPLQKRMRELCATGQVTDVSVSLNANTVLAPNTGWRGKLASGGGVINEFGSHLFSLAVDLVGVIDEITLEMMEVVHSIDSPDRATLRGRSCTGVRVNAALDWSNPDVRKPVYAVRAEFADGSYATHDFFEFSHEGVRSSVADICTAAPVYLRGIEFTAQASHFLANSHFAENRLLSQEVDRLLGMIRAHSR